MDSPLCHNNGIKGKYWLLEENWSLILKVFKLPYANWKKTNCYCIYRYCRVYRTFRTQDEENAFALIETQRNVLKPIVKSHGSQWLKEIGDGLLLIFPSSIQAVNCAIAIQDAVRTNDDLMLRNGRDIMMSGYYIYQMVI